MRTSQTQPVHSQQDTTLKPKKSPKRRTDVFQQVFNKTTTIIHEMWLERNKDRHEPMQGQLRIAKLTEATRTVETLYSLRTLIMKQHESVYYAIPLEEMLEMSVPYMLSWANRWKFGIYHSMRRAKLISLRLTRPIWKMWDPDRTFEPEKRVDCRRITKSKQKKYKEARITTKLRVIKSKKSTSKAKGYEEKMFKQKLMHECTAKDYTPVVNDDLFGDGFND